VIQGAGGGAFLPVALSVATASFTGAARARAIGAVGAIDTLGWVSGPAYGAVVTTQFAAIEEPWRLVFWINIPIAGVLAAVAWRFLENPQIVSKGPAGRRGVTIAKLDLPGFLLLAIFLTAANLALASGGEIGATTGRGLRAFGGTPNPVAGYIPLLLAVAVISVALLALWTLKSRYPILPRQLFRLPRFRSSLGDNFLLGTALMAGMVNVPVIVSLAETSTDVATRSALLLAPFTGFIAAFSIISAQLLPRFGERAVIATGVILAVIGNLSIFPLLESFPYESMVIGLAIAGAGIGLALTPLSTAALDSASDDNRGSAASTLLIFRLLGMTVGVSALTALGVQRLQVLTGSLEGVAQRANESTAEFLLRQQQYVIDRAIPLGVQVIQETFLATALLVAIALIPMWRTGVRRQSESSRS
jgi:MFS family permease